MSRLSDAEEILRRHAIERRHRGQPQSLDPMEDPASAVPRMSEAAWVASCLLVKGVPEFTLQMLEVFYCDSAGSTWTIDVVKIQGHLENVPKHQVAIRLTLTQAAKRLGVTLSYPQARAMHREAREIVVENLLRHPASVRMTAVVP